MAAAFILERLGRRCDKGERAAAQACAAPAMDRVVRQLCGAFAAARLDSSAVEDWLGATHVRASTRVARARAAVQVALEDMGDEALHRARIAVKRARYMLERLAAVEHRADSALIAELQAFQELLGQVHDFAVVSERMMRIARPLAATEPEAARALDAIAERFETERQEALRKLRSLADRAGSAQPLRLLR